MVIEVTFDTTDVYISTTVSPVYVNVSFEAPSGGGGAAWGDITGTLSDQTDLQTALDLRVPYTGATANVDLGEYELKAGQVEFDQTPTGTAGVGVMRWNDSDGTVDLGLKGGNVTLQLGQEQVARVVNKSGVNLLESAYQVVKVTDAQGQRLAVDLAQGNNDANSTDTIGIVTENIDNNQEGFITTSGIVRNINTTGSLQGETWNDGDVLYLSPTTAGAITNVKPTAPNHTVILGYVVYAHAVNGKIFVKCDNGYELGELHDVYVPTPSNNDGIFWNSTNLRYENKSISSALGYTPANAATTLTINGVTYDLSTSRTWTVSTGITGSGASGQVAYWNGASSQSGSNNLFWDATNSRLGIGTNAPTYPLHIRTSSRFGFAYECTDDTASQNYLFLYRNSATPAANDSIGTVLLEGNNSSLVRSTYAYFGGRIISSAAASHSGELYFATTNAGTEADKLVIKPTGNVLIQNGGTFTDSGERLQVTGTMKVTGNVAVDTNTLFVDTTNKRIGVRTATPGAGIDVWNVSTTENGQYRLSDSRLTIPSYSSTGFNPALTSNTCGFFAPTSSTTGGIQFSGLTSNSATASPLIFVGYHGSTAPTIAAIRFLGFKHDGGTNRTALTGTEIIAGFSAGLNADVFQVKANGRINMSSLPTSSTGLATGDLWNDAGTIKIV